MFCHIILFSFFKNYLFYYHFWFAYTNWFCRNNQDLPANVAKRGILCLLDRKLWGVLQPGCWLSVQKFHHIWRAIALNARRRLPLKKQTNKQKTRIKANAISGSDSETHLHSGLWTVSRAPLWFRLPWSHSQLSLYSFSKYKLVICSAPGTELGSRGIQMHNTQL